MEYQNIDAERASLGSMLISKEALSGSLEIMKPEDYYSVAHQLIYRAIIELAKKNKAVDLITLAEELQNRKELIKIGGVQYLVKIVNSVPAWQNIEYYNEIIKKKSNQRKIWRILEETKVGKIEIEEAMEKISALPIPKIEEEDLKTLLYNTIKVSSQGVTYNFEINQFNKYLGGVDKGELITIGGFTSMGKSDLAIQLMINFAWGKETRVLYLSLEMTPLEIARRLLANLNRKNLMDFRKGKFEEGERKALEEVANSVGDYWNLNIKKVFNISDIKKYIHMYNPEIVFVDYLQNLEREGTQTNYQKVTENIKDLQSLTLEKEIVTFVISQLARNKESVRRPRLSDLRDSGRIEECSNIVLFVHWEDRLKEKVEIRTGEEDELPEELEIIISKNRDGTIGQFSLDFYPEFCKITEPTLYFH